VTPQQPDVAGAVLALDQAMIALAVAKSTLLGETSRPVVHAAGPDGIPAGVFADLAAAESDPANPYGSTRLASLRDREHYTEPEAVDSYDASAPNAADWPMAAPHLPQHKGTHPDCTAPGCGQPGQHLHAASIPSGGAA
jgi:hypothetical protein